MEDRFIGKKLDGRYLIQALIGSGGMAMVYKAVDLKENHVVAVKLLREECMENDDLVRRFKNESKAISVLNHANIVKVYDVSVSDRLQYIVMEYVDGITLKDYMEFRKQPLTYRETLHFVLQTLLALQHAHAKGIVHRDIKPQNIMLLANGNIKVMDFGIARFSRSENQTITDKAIGSVHYISPEQAKGDVTDLKADIYSVGVMMYEMLAGRLPFDGENAVGVAIKQISDLATPLCQLNPAVPEALQSITERAMAKEPRERYQSAGAMLADIEAFKRNPSIKFEYQYFGETDPTRYLDKAVNKTAQRRPDPRARAARTRNMAGSSSYAAQNAAANGTAKRRTSRSNTRFKEKWMWPIMAGGTLAFFLVSAFTCYVTLKKTLLFTKADDVPLPIFVGKMRSEIEGNAEYSGFTNIKFEEVADADNPAGRVVSQTPKPPRTVKSNAPITLYVSAGVVQVPVPEIVGMEQAAGVQAVKDAGLYVMIKYERVAKENDPFGFVLKLQSVDGAEVAAGQLMDTGTTIVVYVSSEYQETHTQVPQCIGLASVDEARMLLNSRSLQVGSITEEDSTLPAGSIIRQQPEYVENANKDDPEKKGFAPISSLVNLVISKGHTHTHVEVSRVEPQGCTTPGIITYTCSVCGDTYTQEIPALGHAWGEWVNVERPTVDKEGRDERTCTRDGSHKETRPVEKLKPPDSNIPDNSTGNSGH